MCKAVKITDKNVNIGAPVWPMWLQNQLEIQKLYCGTFYNLNKFSHFLQLLKKQAHINENERESETESTLQFLLWIWEERWRQLSHVITVNSMWEKKLLPYPLCFMHSC